MAQNPTLNQADINLLKQVFATKDDLDEVIEPIKEDIRVIKKDLGTVKKDIKQIKIDINSTLKYVDQQDGQLKKRIVKLEAQQPVI